MLFERGPVAEVVVQRHAGVVDEDVERSDCSGRGLNLRGVGHVQGQRRDAGIRVGQRLARAGVDPLRAAPEGFADQRLPDTAVGPVTRTARSSILMRPPDSYGPSVCCGRPDGR
jgi:hypothetical protein